MEQPNNLLLAAAEVFLSKVTEVIPKDIVDWAMKEEVKAFEQAICEAKTRMITVGKTP